MEWDKLRITKLSYIVAGFGLMLLFWWFIADTTWAITAPQNLWIAHPREVAIRLLNFTKDDWASLGATVYRTSWGFLIVVVAGIPLGLGCGYLSRLYQFLEGPIDFWRSIPPLAVLPIFFFVYKNQLPQQQDSKARISLIVFGCLPIVIMQVADAFRNIPIERRDYAAQIGATLWFRQRWLYVYELMPTIFASLRTVVSFSIIIAVASEMAWGAEKGLGNRISEMRTSYDIPGSYVFALLSGVIGYGANILLRWLERYFIHWQ
jgi:NitT/TauT family transport system permease protein